MSKFSEGISLKFSKLRFASLHKVQSGEQIDQHTEHSIAGEEGQDIHEGLVEQAEHNGNGRHAVAEREELEVLDPQQPTEQAEHNGNGHHATADFLEETAPRLPKVHVLPLENVQSAERAEHNEQQAVTGGEEQTVVDPKQLGKQEKGSEQQATGKLALRGFLDSRRAGEKVQRNGHHTTAEREERSEGHATAELDTQRPGKRVQRNVHIPPRAHPLNGGTEKLSIPVRSFNQVRLASLLTTSAKHAAVSPTPRRPIVRPATVIPPRIQDQERVKFYTAWLDKQAQHDRRHDSANEINDYI